MSSQPLNLVERAAERLRQTRSLDTSAAHLLDIEKTGGVAVPDQPDPIAPVFDAPMRSTPAIDTAVLERAGMIDWSKGRSRVSEEFRIIQSHIMRTAFAPESTGQGLANLVMVTSARPGEGKSFASLNLALSIARQRDHAVLLVDTDSKDESFGRSLGLVDTPGLLDLALDPRLNADDLITPTGFEKLSILPIGTKPEASAELFATRQMTRLIKDLARRYADRVVILDAAPCLSSSDPSTLAPIVGQIVLVVEAERTQRAELESALDLIQSCPTISLLLNKVQVTTSHTFGAYASSYTSS
ncbi:MAG: chromosome partitioning ATPase [Alphaproteobacteria bacterium]|nr:chromosome partitioning ATPase [Alphaproteobacteria bacterium]